MQGEIVIFLKAVQGYFCFIGVKDMEAGVLRRYLGSQCACTLPFPMRLPSLMQNVSKILAVFEQQWQTTCSLQRRPARWREGQGAETGAVCGGLPWLRGGGRKARCSHLWSPSDSCLLLFHLILIQLHPTAGPCSQREQESKSTNKLLPWKASCSRSLHVC